MVAAGAWRTGPSIVLSVVTVIACTVAMVAGAWAWAVGLLLLSFAIDAVVVLAVRHAGRDLRPPERD